MDAYGVRLTGVPPLPIPVAGPWYSYAAVYQYALDTHAVTRVIGHGVSFQAGQFPLGVDLEPTPDPATGLAQIIYQRWTGKGLVAHGYQQPGPEVLGVDIPYGTLSWPAPPGKSTVGIWLPGQTEGSQASYLGAIEKPFDFQPVGYAFGSGNALDISLEVLQAFLVAAGFPFLAGAIDIAIIVLQRTGLDNTIWGVIAGQGSVTPGQQPQPQPPPKKPPQPPTCPDGYVWDATLETCVPIQQQPPGNQGGPGDDELTIPLQQIQATLAQIEQTVQGCCQQAGGGQQGGTQSDCCDKLAAALSAIATAMGGIAQAIAGLSVPPPGGGQPPSSPPDLSALIEQIKECCAEVTGALKVIEADLSQATGLPELPDGVPPPLVLPATADEQTAVTKGQQYIDALLAAQRPLMI
jgi:hypothetical protein